MSHEHRTRMIGEWGMGEDEGMSEHDHFDAGYAQGQQHANEVIEELQAENAALRAELESLVQEMDEYLHSSTYQRDTPATVIAHWRVRLAALLRRTPE